MGRINRDWVVELVLGGLFGLVTYEFLGVWDALIFLVLFTVGFVLGLLARMESGGVGSGNTN